MAKAKEDRRIRQEIVRVSRGVHGASTLKKKKRRTKKRKVGVLVCYEMATL